ncbi:O-antigen ligase family protein [Litoribacter populi]|uniref:O-antigen ligase family protein n=1 Tax=Litoribacter populi TaxID=2598460 RepID=UPI00117C5B77|nr:O-antigen ligase family protein [Litoribacter populi]
MNSFIKYSAFFVGAIGINQVFIVSPEVNQSIYYGICGLYFVLLLFSGGANKLNLFLCGFLFFAMVSILLNSIPSQFQPWFRLASFLIMIGLLGPFISSPKFFAFRYFTFSKVNLFILILGSASFLTKILPLRVPEGRGGWSGFFVHTMILGPMASISLLLALYLFYHEKISNRPNKKLILLYQICMSSSFLSLLLASSRTAILACIGALLFFFYKIYQQRLSKFLYTILIISGLIGLSSPIWLSYADGIQNKMQDSDKKGDLVATRRSIWDARFLEFYESPIYGVGFSHLKYNAKKKIDDDGKVEPGSSFLAALSMTGILGFLMLIGVFVSYIAFVIKDKTDILNIGVLGSLLIFFSIHMLAEGYLLSSGGVMFFYLWLLLGNIEIFKQTGKIQII